MNNRPRRLTREERTVTAMIRLYCQHHHRQHYETTDTLCAECLALADYARARLDKCPYQAQKPTCANCPIHCYKPHMRDRIRAVMRYAGPRMLIRHPWLAVLHIIDGLKKAPDLERI